MVKVADCDFVSFIITLVITLVYFNHRTKTPPKHDMFFITNKKGSENTDEQISKNFNLPNKTEKLANSSKLMLPTRSFLPSYGWFKILGPAGLNMVVFLKKF